MGKATPELLDLIIHGFKKWDELDGQAGDGVSTELIHEHIRLELIKYRDSEDDKVEISEDSEGEVQSVENPYAKQNYTSAAKPDLQQMNPATDKVVV